MGALKSVIRRSAQGIFRIPSDLGALIPLARRRNKLRVLIADGEPVLLEGCVASFTPSGILFVAGSLFVGGAIEVHTRTQTRLDNSRALAPRERGRPQGLV
jgi:hypothetical protein